MTTDSKYTDAEVSSAKRYMREFGGAMTWYAVLMIGASYLSREATPAARFGLAILPMLPLWMALRAALRFFRRSDEFARRVQFEAVGFGFVGGVMLSMTYGLLEAIADLPRLSWTWVPPLFLALWGIGGVIASRRYR